MASIRLFFRLSCLGLVLLVQIGSASSIPEEINIREGYFLNDDPNLQDDWSTNNDIDVDKSYTLRNLRQVALPTERDRRYGVVDKVEHGKVYSIQNMRDSMYLSAKAGPGNPSPVIVMKFTNQPNQLWSVTKVDNNRLDLGFSLKPLKNEFNIVTSRLDYLKMNESPSHSFIPWKLERVKGIKYRDNIPWHIYHVERKKKMCLRSNGYSRPVSVEPCNDFNKYQMWEFRQEESQSEDDTEYTFNLI